MIKTNLTLKILKIHILLLFASIVGVLIGCSTKKNSFVNRNWHALNTEYNVLYNGNVALDLGINDLKSGYKDNFWETLPIERMQIPDEGLLPGQKSKNQNFERAETKATKAIQKHSMNIERREKNPQMDEAYLLLGKSRYYDQRFIPALEAFNYILYKNADSDKIYESKIWREKTNIRLENDALAIKNLKKLLKEKKLKPQVLADANAILAQGYVNLEQKDSAIAPLKKALENTKLKEEKARYNFILGQLYQALKYNDSAYNSFQSVIEMKRKSPKAYVIQAYAKQSELVNQTNDTVLFLKKYEKLFKDRENRPYLDILNYQMAQFYDQLNRKEQAIKYYNKSLKARTGDTYLQASAYKNLATIYFDKKKYLTAGKYYDSTLVNLIKKNKEYFTFLKKRENLEDVIKYEGIVKNNDSILHLSTLSESEKEKYFNNYIASIKEKELAEKVKVEKEKELKANGIQDIENNTKVKNKTEVPNIIQLPPNVNTTVGNDAFYFYNPTAVAYGKITFVKNWGKLELKDNWAWEKESNTKNNIEQSTSIENTIVEKDTTNNPKYQANYYIKQIPTSPQILDSLSRELNFANYQLGVIYKEKFKEYPLALTKFQSVLQNKPEDRLILPSLYNEYKIYELLDKSKAEEIKDKIILNYPNTRYAQILSGKLVETDSTTLTPELAYKELYKLYKNQEYSTLITNLEASLAQLAGDDIMPKLELLKANVLAKTEGLEAYKKTLNYVALNYPNAEEGKQAEEIMRLNIPVLEKLELKKDSLSKNWNIIYKVGAKKDKITQLLIEKLEKYFKDNQYSLFTVSIDAYSSTENFVVVHGISSIEFAQYLVNELQKNKATKITEQAIIISSDNYSVIQIKKLLPQYLELK